MHYSAQIEVQKEVSLRARGEEREDFRWKSDKRWDVEDSHVRVMLLTVVHVAVLGPPPL